MKRARPSLRCWRGLGLSLALLIPTNVLPTRVFAAEPRGENLARDVLKEAYELGSRYKVLPISFFWRDEIRRIEQSYLKAGEIDAVLETLKFDRNFDINPIDFDLAIALARSGRRKEAEEWMRKADQGCCCGDPVEYRKTLDDQLRVGYLQHEIATGNLPAAGKVQREITTTFERPIAARELAVAYAKAGDRATSKRLFREALDNSLTIPIKKPAAAGELYSDGWSRTHALWEICDAQLAVHDTEGAAETARALVKAAQSIRHGLSRMQSLHQAARRLALLGDRNAAQRLFVEATECRDAVKPPIPYADANKAHELGLIARSQAELGFSEDALKTAQMIPAEEWYRPQAIGDIAVAIAKSRKIDRAQQVALSIKDPLERHFRDEALTSILSRQIDLRDLKGALATASKIDDPLDQAVARLNVAIEFAILGDRQSATTTAAQTRLVEQSRLIKRPKIAFDYQAPRTWGVIYDEEPAGGLSGYFASIRRTSKLASTAFKLSHLLQLRYAESFAKLLADCHPETVVAVAREQTALGRAQDALAWAREIGTLKLKGPKDPNSLGTGADLRIAALLGIAEGILQREGKLQPSLYE